MPVSKSSIHSEIPPKLKPWALTEIPGYRHPPVEPIMLAGIKAFCTPPKLYAASKAP